MKLEISERVLFIQLFIYVFIYLFFFLIYRDNKSSHIALQNQITLYCKKLPSCYCFLQFI